MRLVGPQVGCTRLERVVADVGQRPPVRVGVVVEEHRHPVRVRPPAPERTGRQAGDLPLGNRAAQPDERDDVERADAGVYANVSDDVDVLRDRVGQPAGRAFGVTRPGTGHREHRPVVVGIGVHVEQ